MSTALTGYDYMTIDVMTFNSVKTSSVLFIAIIYVIINRKATSLRKIRGIILGTISLLIIISVK